MPTPLAITLLLVSTAVVSAAPASHASTAPLAFQADTAGASLTTVNLTTVFSRPSFGGPAAQIDQSSSCDARGRCWFCFRIPAVKFLPNGHILAFAEARNNR